MHARHPITGAPIRIIKSESSLWRNNKTLVWLDETADLSKQWDRWDIAVTSTKAARALEGKLDIHLVVCLGDSETTMAWLRTAPKSCIIAIPRAVAMQFGLDALVALQLSTILCLEEINILYPYAPKWDGTVEGAKLTLGTMMHYKVNHTTPSVHPRPIWYITQYYKPDKKKRAQELEDCLIQNLSCKYIDKVVLLNEKAIAPFHPKLEEHVIKRRLTYADVIRWVHENVPPEVIVVFANADIHLDGSWRNIWSVDLEDTALALLRWDIKEGKPVLFGPRADSQDTWVLSAAAVKKRTWDWKALEFPFGQGGCDNAIAMELFRQKFLVVNPAFTLRTLHLHESQVRTYDPRDIVMKPAYLYIEPTGIHDLQPVVHLPKAFKTFKPAPFERRIQGPASAARAKTYAVMASKATGLTLDVGVANTYAPVEIPLFKYNDVFVLKEGLAYTKDSILIGTTAAAKKAWSQTNMSTLSRSVSIRSALVAPLSSAVASNPVLYALNYLGKILLMRQTMDGDFWCSKAAEDVLRIFKWDSATIPVISRDDTQQTWCSEALVWNEQDTGSDQVTKEEVAALRSNLRIQRGLERRLVVVGSDWITSDIVDALEKIMPVTVLWSDTSVELIADALVGACGLVTHGPLGSWAWMMPAGAVLFEIQCEMNPAIDLLHLAGAAGLDHQLYIVARGKPTEKQLGNACDAIIGVLNKDPVKRLPTEATAKPPISKPLLKLPNRTGFFGHTGDSFREMARLWAERGYVAIEPTTSGHIWLNDDIVLYDRDTYQWYEAEPVACPMLVGNPAPTSPIHTPWTYWPRRPSIVEDLSGLDVPRLNGLVFYGRSENAVQRRNRTKEDWASVCDEFVHVDGLKPYPFTHEEYLRKLAGAKWGLCLAGFGTKCHREIECMAMGCVPIVAPEVDITSYAVPPIEGVHYFRAADPLSAQALVAGASDEDWQKMSTACKEWWRLNASVDGSWALTKRLLNL